MIGEPHLLNVYALCAVAGNHLAVAGAAPLTCGGRSGRARGGPPPEPYAQSW